MTRTESEINHSQLFDCRHQFRLAYENRYTWDPEFSGYIGDCKWSDGFNSKRGSFIVDRNLKVMVNDINDENISKKITSQLWEVTIHRVRRPFDEVHGKNIFKAGESTSNGLEVLVSGKNAGDKYRIKDNIVTMVNRNIHGSLIKIYTKSTYNTRNGYLGKEYSSQYFDPESGVPRDNKKFFSDKFVSLFEGGPWVLSERKIFTETFNEEKTPIEVYSFSNLTKYDLSPEILASPDHM